MQRFDFVFSYWLFAWYATYMLGLVTFNPLPFLVVGGAVNFIQLISGKIKNPKSFLLINLFIKILPIASLVGTQVKQVDIKAGFIYVFAYLTWMYVNKESWLKVRTPLTDLISDLTRTF